MIAHVWIGTRSLIKIGCIKLVLRTSYKTTAVKEFLYNIWFWVIRSQNAALLHHVFHFCIWGIPQKHLWYNTSASDTYTPLFHNEHSSPLPHTRSLHTIRGVYTSSTNWQPPHNKGCIYFFHKLAASTQ